MQTTLLIADNFYSNPHDVRQFALQQEFSVKGNYPGSRTVPFLNESTKQGIQRLVEPHSGKIVDWGEQYSGCFQLCTATDRTWIHADTNNTWAGVLYLTPNAPLSGGTALYRHKLTGHIREDLGILYNFYDYTQWDVVDQVGNVFNRLVMYRGDLFHASVDYFGSNMSDGRLIQTFFISTER